MTAINRQWCLAHRPEGDIEDGDLELRETPVPEPGAGQCLVRNIYLSLDPTNRIWMSDADQYMPPVEIGDVMRGGTIGVVERSNGGSFKVGDVIQGLGGWQDYYLTDGVGASRIPTEYGFPLPAYMGLLGMIGATAYFGLLDIGQPKAGETVVVSAAAGAVGSIVGQIAKLKGCRVVGIAGSDAKCQWLVDDLGFDAAINYKTEDVLAALRRHCPNGIDVDFENVGGEILDAVLSLLNLKARIVLCGLISQYNATEPVPGPYNFTQILMKRARLEGFIILDYAARFPEAITELGQWLSAGKIQYRVDIAEGLEHAPTTVKRLFSGGNTGKLMVKVSEEPV